MNSIINLCQSSLRIRAGNVWNSSRSVLRLKLLHSAGEAVVAEEILDFSSLICLICIKSHWKHTSIFEEIVGWF